jgi:hypothetical protein
MPQWNGLLATKPKPRPLNRMHELLAARHHACDRCGYSTVDGKPISAARHFVIVGFGGIYLCGHHFRKHGAHILERGYETSEVSK